MRELQDAPIASLLAANAAAIAKLTDRAPGWTANSPMVDGTAIPGHPWDPAAPAISAAIPLLIGYVRTEETLYDRPTAETLALDEAGLRKRVAARLGIDPDPVVAVYRKAHPEASPWDLHILIATDHPRGTYARELAMRKASQGAAPAYLYRFDWETPEGGGHMRSPHAVEVQFVFNNIAVGGPLISKRADAFALAGKVSAAWAAFARTGNPGVAQLPRWPAYPPGLATRCCSTTTAGSDRILTASHASRWRRCSGCHDVIDGRPLSPQTLRSQRSPTSLRQELPACPPSPRERSPST